jgi:glucan phosphoethanolaminetransferase (alkaline phosphatase superfamily)
MKTKFWLPIAIALSRTICAFYLALGIAESYYLSKYNLLDNQIVCLNVKTFLIVACLFDFLVPIVSFIIYIYRDLIIRSIRMNRIIGTSSSIFNLIVLLIVKIWAVVIYFKTNSICRDFLSTNTPEFLTFILIHTIIFWIFCGSVVLVAIIILIESILYKKRPINNVSEIEMTMLCTKYTDNIPDNKVMDKTVQLTEITI